MSWFSKVKESVTATVTETANTAKRFFDKPPESSPHPTTPKPVLPWENCPSDISASIKERIRDLADDIDTANVPHELEASCNINISSNTTLLVALLNEIPSLRHLRLWFVPRKLTEQMFWKRILCKIYDVRHEIIQSKNDDSPSLNIEDPKELDLDSISESEGDEYIDPDLEAEIEKALADENNK
ncbi:hypothetical protein P9112_009761 [Eukaryota sp. TZLM1-RC]